MRITPDQHGRAIGRSRSFGVAFASGIVTCCGSVHAMGRPIVLPHFAPSRFPISTTTTLRGGFASGDASKTWTGAASNGLWSAANNWTSTGAPSAGDTIVFPTLSAPYNVTNDQVASPIYAVIALDGTAAGKPTFNGGFSANELLATSLAGSTWNAGTYSIVGRSTFRGQTITTLNAGASLQSTSPSHTLYLWEQASLNVNSGASIDLSGSDSIIGIDDNAALNVNAGGNVQSTNLLVSNDNTAGARNVNVNGSGAQVRVDFQTLVHTNAFGAPARMANFNISNGGRFSTGIMEVNRSATATGLSADTNIIVNNATFEISNAVGFENSYFASGVANGPGVTTINLTNGGQFNVSDTDGSGQAFVVFSNGYRADTQVTIGGMNASGVKSTMRIDGLMFAAPAVRNPAGGVQTLTRINVNAGGQLLVRDASIFASDQDYAALIDVRGGGFVDLGERAIFSGGNSIDSPAGGAGQTSVLVQGELRAGSFEYLADSASTSGHGGSTTILVNSAGAMLIADGVDNPATPEIDSGYFAPSRGNGTPGSDLAIDGIASCTFESRVEANEAFFAGDMQSGQFSLDVTGTSALLDAGGLFAVNDRGLADSAVSIQVRNGGKLAATSASNGTPGAIRINTKPGTGTASVIISSGGTIESAGTIQIGGSLLETSPGVFHRSVGTPASMTGDGTIIAGGSLYLGTGSTLVTNRFDVKGAYIDGAWLAGTGGTERRIRTGELRIWPTGSVTMMDGLISAFPSLVVTRNVSVDSGAKFDLKNHAMLIRPDPGSPDPTTLAILKQLLANGRAIAGTGGISSSFADSTTALGYSLVSQAGTFLGEPTLPGDLLVRYTLKGDADLNGAVNFDDLLLVAQHYDAAGEWFTGDFTFDGAVNFDDLLIVAQNYGTSFLSPETKSDSFAADWLLARSLVPEPLAGFGVIGMFACIRRRR